MHLGLIGCTEKKLSGMHEARDLYIGNSFVSARAIVEHICDEWLILSALYGVLRPDKRITPYDRSLESLSAVEYMSWCQGVAANVIEVMPTKVTLIAPDKYVGLLPIVLRSRDIEVDVRPRVDIHSGLKSSWYMACAQCGMCGPFRTFRESAILDAVGHPCRVKEQ